MTASPNPWELNLQALKARQAQYDLFPPCPGDLPVFQRVSLIPGDTPSLQLTGDRLRPVTLHSPRDAWKEAATLVRQAPLGQPQPLIVLGLGLGYHILCLLPQLAAEHPLIIVEREPEVFWAALHTLDLTPLLTRPHTTLVVEPEAANVLHHLRRKMHLVPGRPVCFWGHPPSLRAGNDFYQEIITGLKSPAPARPRTPGLHQERLRVLVVNTDYFLIPEVHQGFRQLGHEVQLVLFDKRRDEGETVVCRILAALRDFAPDLVFTINHLGFDREGVLVDAFHRLRVPSVSWYVDSPAIILNLYQGPKSDLAFIFVWDPTYIPDVQGLGFDKVFPLPLATDPEIFRPRPPAELAPWRTQVSFVGNSLIGSVEKKLARLPSSPAFLKLFETLVAAYRAQPFRRLEALLAAAGLKDHPLILQLDHTGRTDLEAGIIWAATRDYRLACLKPLAPFQPVIFGDPGWRHLVSAPFRLFPEVNYFDDLPAIYGASAINFNATSLQMKTAINQRVFDAPAAGGFLLTDFREQLGELFRIGKEVICYYHPEEVADLARFYLQHDTARQKIVQRGHARILAEHTYRHRLQTMLAIMRRSL